MRYRLAGLAGLIVASGACQVDGLNLMGRHCPCADPWVCDASRDLCLLAEGSGEGSVTVSNLRLAWSTPNQIRWQWDPVGSPDQLLRYELSLAESERDLLEGTNVRVFTEQENPELSRYELLGTHGVDTVRSTLTDELVPDHTYHARLFAFDTAGGLSVSNIASGKTTPAPSPNNQIEIYGDTPPPGWRTAGFDPSTNAPYHNTSQHMEFTATCPMNNCWENLRMSDLGISMAAVTAGAYSNTAFVEFAISSDGDPTSYWTETVLYYGCPDEVCRWEWSGWTMRSDGQYRLLQFPLRVLRQGGITADFALLAQGLAQFRVGGMWELGATVRIDEVYIRW